MENHALKDSEKNHVSFLSFLTWPHKGEGNSRQEANNGTKNRD